MTTIRTPFLKNMIILAVCGLGLVACGATTDVPFVDPFEDRRQNFASYEEGNTALEALLPITRVNSFTPATVAGDASYDGVMLISFDKRAPVSTRFLGELSFDVAFGDENTLSGSATNFLRQSDGAALDGRLEMSAEGFVPDNVRADVGGLLTLPEGTELLYNFGIGGAFRNDTATTYAGETTIFLPSLADGTLNEPIVQIWAEGAGVTPPTGG